MDDTFPIRPTAPRRRTGRGFTLVEMLVVIAIIAVLAGLITVAGAAAIKSAKQTTIKNDITQLEMAVNAYKEKRGDNPPDFADVGTDQGKVLVLRHLRKAFPRYILSGAQWGQLEKDIADYALEVGLSLNVNTLSPSEALVFWLGGLPDDEGNLSGFSADPAYPFRAGGSRTDALFEFDKTRLFDDDGDGWLSYKSEHAKGNVPYVYFRVRTCQDHGHLLYEHSGHGGALSWDGGAAGVCVPYCNRDDDDWNKPKTFQIISPGMDGLFGAATTAPNFHTLRLTATGVGFTDGDYDNITNFSNTTLEDGLE